MAWRPSLVVVVVVAAFVLAGSAPAGQEPQASALDRDIPATTVWCEPGLDCLWSVLWSLGLPIGIEFDRLPVSEVAPANQESLLKLPPTTLAALLDQFVKEHAEYEWRELNGFPVVRPRSAWNDRGNVLNRPIESFDLEEVGLTHALSSLCQGRFRGCGCGYLLSTQERDPFSVHFTGGPLVDAIIALTQASGSFAWRVDRRHLTVYRRSKKR